MHENIQITHIRPDLDYRNPRVEAEMSEMLKFYIDRGVSGFRLDAVSKYQKSNFSTCQYHFIHRSITCLRIQTFPMNL